MNIIADISCLSYHKKYFSDLISSHLILQVSPSPSYFLFLLSHSGSSHQCKAAAAVFYASARLSLATGTTKSPSRVLHPNSGSDKWVNLLSKRIDAF